MRIKIIILTILFSLFWVSPAFAVTVTISDVPSSVADQELTFNASVSDAQAGTNYLRANFFPTGTTSYFGYTYNGSSFVNSSTCSDYLPITIDSSGNWSGTVKAKIDTSSSYYTGSGTYSFKMRRYTQSCSSSYIWSNEVTISVLTSSPSSSPSPTSNPFPTTSSSASFSISNVPSQIDSTEEFNVSVNLSLPNSPNTTFYLKGAFKKQDKTNYFGLTKASGSWIKNNKTYSDQYKITTDGSGFWSGNLEIQPDILDSGYEGAGDYIFKVGRYTEGGSLSWSSEVTIKISAQEVILDERLEDTPKVLGINEKPGKKSISSKSKDEELSLEKYIKVASPAGVAQAAVTPQPEVKGEKQTNYLSWIGGFMVISGIGVFAYVYLRNRSLREAIFNIFRKRD